MVRISLPGRLKSSYGINGANGGSKPGSRSASPMRQGGQNLVLRTTVVKVIGSSGSDVPFVVAANHLLSRVET